MPTSISASRSRNKAKWTRRRRNTGGWSNSIPRHAMAYNNLGNALKELGRVQECEAQFRRALELKPDYTEAHYNLAKVLVGT